MNTEFWMEFAVLSRGYIFSNKREYLIGRVFGELAMQPEHEFKESGVKDAYT